MGKKVKKFAKKSLNVMTLGASGYIDKKLNQKPPEPGDAPDPAPIPDDELMLTNNRRKAAMRPKGGRSSTILSSSNNLG